MSGQNGGNSADELKRAVHDHLDGETRENALMFAKYLIDNQLTPNMAAEGKIPFNGHNLGWMQIEGRDKWSFQIFNFLCFGEFNDEDADFVRTVHDHVNICHAPCHDQCWRAKDAKIFGKEFKSVCSQHSRSFVNPDRTTIEHMKKLIEYSKKTTPYAQQYHPNNP